MATTIKNIGVFTSGGDSPGMNACIRAVVRRAASENINVFGIRRGYEGMIEGDIFPLYTSDVANIIHRGGTILKTARSKAFMTPEGRKKAFEELQKKNIDGLVCIGGNGSYTGAEVFYNEYKIPSIGCPGTIDNDLYGSDYTIGFDTAVNTAVEAIDKIRDTAEAHNRVFFVEVMGRDSGFIGLFSGIAGGAECVIIPEVDDEFNTLVSRFKSDEKRKKKFSIILVSEKDKEGNAFEIAKKFKQHFPEIDERVCVLGHIQRGGNPTANDRILASRLGNAAVKHLLLGETNKAVGVINNHIELTSYNDARNNKKTINPSLIRLSEILSS